MVFSPIPDFPRAPVLSLEEAAQLPRTGGPAALPVRDRALEDAVAALSVKLGSRLLLPEAWSQLLPQAGVLVSSAISGGTLKERFQEAARAYSHRCWLFLEPMRMEFPLPCPTGTGTPVSALSGHTSFYSDALCCYYSHFIRENQGFMILWDTEETMAAKLELARACGFSGWAAPENFLQYL